MQLLPISIVLIMLASTQVDSFKVMVQVEEESMNRYNRFAKRQAIGSACEDYQEVSRDNLTLPGDLDS